MVSKVTAVQAVGTYNDQYGEKFTFLYTFEDGSVLRANHKTNQPKFPVGSEADFEVKGVKDGIAWGTVKKPDAGPYQSSSAQYKNDDKIGCQWAINAAMNWLQYQVTSGQQMSMEEIEKAARQLLQVRERLNS